MNRLQNRLAGAYFRFFSTNSYGYSPSNERKSVVDQSIFRFDPQSPTHSWNESIHVVCQSLEQTLTSQVDGLLRRHQLKSLHNHCSTGMIFCCGNNKSIFCACCTQATYANQLKGT